ncbi:isochorismatase family cysteine hydrolase [Microbacterium sp. C23T]
MTTRYDPTQTGLLVVDPYNDFLAETGKLWPAVAEVAAAVRTVERMRAVVSATRLAGARVFFVPHRRWMPGDTDQWRFPNASQLSAARLELFAKDTWGGTFHDEFPVLDGDVVVSEHWAQSGFANTDLDQQLRQRGIDHVIIVGLLANTCVESTGRFAMEAGHHVTLVPDATAAYSADAMHAAHTINAPTFAHEILTTVEVVRALVPVPSAA